VSSYFHYGGASASMEPKVHKIFPTCIWEFECPVDNQDEILADLMEKWDLRERDSSCTDGFQSRPDLHTDPLYQNLCTKVLIASQTIWDEYLYHDIVPTFTAMWANALGKSANIHTHSHSNSFFSGVWYPDHIECDNTHEVIRPITGQLPDHGESPQGCILFQDAVKRYTLMPKVFASNEINTGEYMMRPQKGMLLLFPSWLEHGTIAYLGNKPRFSISFNIWMKGELGHSSALNQLTIL
jgi:uncharacterized protein (TIGR02466 family)